MILAALLAVMSSISLAAEGPSPATVLVVYSNSRLLQANIDVDRALNARSPDAPYRDVRTFSEFLDAPQFSGQTFETDTAAYLRRKYAARRPDAIVAAGGEALAFLLRHREEMFPKVPVVHVGVERGILDSMGSPLPADVVGIPAVYDFEGTLRLALRLHPSIERLIVVTGAAPWDRDQEAQIRRVIAGMGVVVPVEYLAALAQDEVVRRLAQLPRHSVVLTPGYFADGAGTVTTPRDSVQLMVSVATAPVYTPFATQMGIGVVGGRMASFEAMGRTARGILDRILSGSPPSSLRLPASTHDPVQLDWRQVDRWAIPARLVPADAIIHYRVPSIWETHRTQVLVAIAALLIQAGLIVALLVERRARRRVAAALADSQRQMGLAVDAARLSPFAWNAGDHGAVPVRGGHGGRGEDDAVAQALAGSLDVVHPADRARVDAAVRAALANDAGLDIEYRTVGEGGRVRWFAARGRPAGGGTGASLTGVRMDITGRKEAELQAEADRTTLRRLSRISTMGQLSAAIAHQLNQPLTAILGNAETARKLVARGRASTEDLTEILDDIVTEDHRAAQVIRRLGDLYRRGDVEFTRLDLGDLVRETVGLLHAELVLRQVTPTVSLAENLPAVMGNRVQVQQVLLNLVLNAADAMAGVAPGARTIGIRTAFDDPHVTVCVSDHGNGIAEENLARVFEPFWTTKEHGLGVGLAICSAIAASHKGMLVATNNAEGGATFCLSLPAVIATEPEAGIADRVPG